ncbi:helix-turn-helix transcriptional regulator [Curtobacterium sp. MCBD17_032]|uniref:helix-turn-helix transcriptional regulator n=1 Tax=Curtobacterium sp. MCBD17_032 TaxID=2175659 RepID=UPI000DA934D7|nr:helix-turn-helix transcriptional regulator [Curtobacterium sp. MCBD17_032]PZE80676.1 transcriptional regulator [Curtobacterium sp. MCBD17_032]
MVRLPLSPVDLERGRRLGALLRSARGSRSMLEVALDAGVSPETLRKIETGRIATPSFPTVAALAAVLGLSLDALWADVGAASGSVRPAVEVAVAP